MKNLNKSDLRKLAYKARRKSNFCFPGWYSFLGSSSLLDFWENCNYPGWLAILLKLVIWDIFSNEEKDKVVNVLSVRNISVSDSQEDKTLCNLMREDLSDLFD